jgi:hypothetical protein
MPVEQRGWVTRATIGGPTGSRRSTLVCSGRRQPSVSDTSRISREVYVRFCEGLGVKFPGSTRRVMAIGPKLPRPSLTLPSRRGQFVGFRGIAAVRRERGGAIDPKLSKTALG